MYIEKKEELQSLFESAALEFSQESILNYIDSHNDVRCRKIYDFLNSSEEIKDVEEKHKSNNCVVGNNRS
jgi:hypothetical protein